MNNMKKFASLLLALVMLLAMAAPAMAEGGNESGVTTYTLTLNNAQVGHTYSAYQIFAGDLHDKTLSNIVWGAGVTEAGQTALGNAADKAKTIAEAKDAEEFAAEVAQYLGTAAGSATVAEGTTTCTISGLEAGYYLIQTTGVTAENDVYTYYIMKIVKDTSASIKADVPEIDKEIQGEDDAADANIGDTVTFVLTATMPDRLDGYETYKVVFHDTLSEGLDFTEGTVKVMIGEKNVTGSFIPNEENGTLTISCDDVLAIGATASAQIVVTYDAVIDADAAIGSAGNPNKASLEYSNNPNWDGTGDEPTGNTPEDVVVVFTYRLDADKINASNVGLENAQFILMDEAKKKIAKISGGKLVEWVDINTVTVNDDGTYPVEYTMISNADGDFGIIGLDAGTYYLKETKAPAGYNLLADPIKIVITATITDTEEKQELTALTISVDDGAAADGNVSNGSVETDVVNEAGAIFPETGGMGTTAIYAMGSLLIVGAALALLMKKRVAA